MLMVIPCHFWYNVSGTLPWPGACGLIYSESAAHPHGTAIENCICFALFRSKALTGGVGEREKEREKRHKGENWLKEDCFLHLVLVPLDTHIWCLLWHFTFYVKYCYWVSFDSTNGKNLSSRSAVKGGDCAIHQEANLTACNRFKPKAECGVQQNCRGWWIKCYLHDNISLILIKVFKRGYARPQVVIF